MKVLKMEEANLYGVQERNTASRSAILQAIKRTAQYYPNSLIPQTKKEWVLNTLINLFPDDRPSRLKQILEASRLLQSRIWTERELSLMREFIEEGAPFEEIRIPGRTRSAVENVFCRLKPRKISVIKQTPRWREDEVISLCEQFAAHHDVRKIIIPGRTEQGMRFKLNSLGLFLVRWTNLEIRSLQDQAREGKMAEEIKITGRTALAIADKAKREKISLKKRYDFWAPRELNVLQSASAAGKSPKEVVVFGRSRNSVRRKMVELNLFKTNPHVNLSWTDEEIVILTKLVVEDRMSAGEVSRTGVFGSRTVDSIAQKMKRLKLVARRDQNES